MLGAWRIALSFGLVSVLPYRYTLQQTTIANMMLKQINLNILIQLGAVELREPMLRSDDQILLRMDLEGITKKQRYKTWSNKNI